MIQCRLRNRIAGDSGGASGAGAVLIFFFLDIPAVQGQFMISMANNFGRP